MLQEIWTRDYGFYCVVNATDAEIRLLDNCPRYKITEVDNFMKVKIVDDNGETPLLRNLCPGGKDEITKFSYTR